MEYFNEVKLVTVVEGKLKDPCFRSHYTKVLGRLLLHSLDFTTLLLTLTYKAEY